MYNRYGDIEKFITDINELKMDEEGCVYISDINDYDIIVDLEDKKECFEEMKPTLVELAKHICELDNIAQRYNRWSNKSLNFEDEIGLIYIDEPNIITLEYWGTRVNTEYLVVFEQNGEEFVLKSFGMTKNIPDNWDK